MEKKFLTPNQLAARWGTTYAALAVMRYRQQGPNWIKPMKKKVLYPIEEVEAYEQRTALNIGGAKSCLTT
ncbi:DNA-binding protein [Tropicibacter sp. Alg240-R139]|uniref:DNA-binding protein n=1 Tax=Tropicibacter sp. Alg240-R139 TaxID=2305991 RepID=UPI0013DF4DDA|nr:DNA-binding protein [Tropicibacter sp. Alg240-R139]